METNSIRGVGKSRHGTYLTLPNLSFLLKENGPGSSDIEPRHIREEARPGAYLQKTSTSRVIRPTRGNPSAYSDSL